MFDAKEEELQERPLNSMTLFHWKAKPIQLPRKGYLQLYENISIGYERISRNANIPLEDVD